MSGTVEVASLAQGAYTTLAHPCITNQIANNHDVPTETSVPNGDIGDNGDKCPQWRLTSCPGMHDFLKITLDTRHSNAINTDQRGVKRPQGKGSERTTLYQKSHSYVPSTPTLSPTPHQPPATTTHHKRSRTPDVLCQVHQAQEHLVA